MNAKTEKILTVLENSSESAAISVADHLRTVAENGPEYATREALREEAKALRDWALYFINLA